MLFWIAPNDLFFFNVNYTQLDPTAFHQNGTCHTKNSFFFLQLILTFLPVQRFQAGSYKFVRTLSILVCNHNTAFLPIYPSICKTIFPIRIFPNLHTVCIALNTGWWAEKKIFSISVARAVWRLCFGFFFALSAVSVFLFLCCFDTICWSPGHKSHLICSLCNVARYFSLFELFYFGVR